jgi:hypothetical protein
MRTKIPDLTMACAGRFADHHALLACQVPELGHGV